MREIIGKKISPLRILIAIGLFVIGIGCVVVNFIPFDGVVSFSVILAILGVFGTGLGVRLFSQSFKVKICRSCHKSLSFWSKATEASNEKQIMDYIERHVTVPLESMHFDYTISEPFIVLTLEYCPTCRNVGLMSVSKKESGSQAVIVENKLIDKEYLNLSFLK